MLLYYRPLFPLECVTICNVRKIVIALSDDGKSVTFMMASTKYRHRHRQTDRQTDRHVITISHFACILKGDQNRLDHSSLAEVINRFENVIVAATGCSGLIN